METKPGPKTTEFWTMLFTNVLALIQVVAGPVNIHDSRLAIPWAIVNGLYIFSRGQAKQGVPYTAPPE